jgi:hypothetical protein
MFMKKSLFLAFLLCLVAGFVYFSTRQSTPVKQAEPEQAKEPVLAHAGSVQARPEPTHQESVAEPKEPASAAASPVTESVLVARKMPVRAVITNTVAEFSKGETNNVILSDGSLRLGDDATPTTFQNKYKLFGLFHSLPEDLPAPIDRVFPNYQATIPDGGALTFAFRTRSADGKWSTWNEVNPDQLNQPIMLEEPGVSVQYKLMLFGNDTASSPQITSVLMGTQTAAEPATTPNSVPSNTQAQ